MSFLDKLKNRMAEVRENVTTAIEESLVDDKTKEDRLALCHSCDHLFKPTSQCTKCGCFVHAKAALKSSSCPIGKWIEIKVEK